MDNKKIEAVKKEIRERVSKMVESFREKKESDPTYQNVELQALYTEWSELRKHFKNSNRDIELIKIDLEYSNKIENFMRDNEIPDARPASLPMQIPTGLFHGELKNNKKKKIEEE